MLAGLDRVVIRNNTQQACKDVALILHMVALLETQGYDGCEVQELADRIAECGQD